MKEKLRRNLNKFMIGRYGVDELSRFLNIAVFVFLISGILLSPYISYLGMLILLYEYFRVFSKNINKRAKENVAYLNIKICINKWIANRKLRFSQRKTHRFYTCPKCKKTVRIPKGKGKVSITCPVCSTQFERKS